MKQFMYWGVWASIALLSSCGSSSDADEARKDSTGMPGDHFSLSGALELFKESKDLAEFEKALNSKDNVVNNLDLDKDGKTDYIRVADLSEKDAHAIVMQVPVNKEESQDVAVIQIEKTGKESARIQIVGNGILYGDSAVLAPSEGDNNKVAKAEMIPLNIYPTVAAVEVNVWLWPPVQLLYTPAYVAYSSPVVFGVYPTWYEPWPPKPWGWYHAKSKKYKKAYVPVYTPGLIVAHSLYLGNARFSPFVMERHPIIMKHQGPKLKKWQGPVGGMYGRPMNNGNIKFEKAGKGNGGIPKPKNDGFKNGGGSKGKAEGPVMKGSKAKGGNTNDKGSGPGPGKGGVSGPSKGGGSGSGKGGKGK